MNFQKIILSCIVAITLFSKITAASSDDTNNLMLLTLQALTKATERNIAIAKEAAQNSAQTNQLLEKILKQLKEANATSEIMRKDLNQVKNTTRNVECLMRARGDLPVFSCRSDRYISPDDYRHELHEIAGMIDPHARVPSGIFSDNVFKNLDEGLAQPAHHRASAVARGARHQHMPRRNIPNFPPNN